MAKLTDLSGELLLTVAYFMTQTDLLNTSLACQRLRAATEPELFREYVNRHSRRKSFLTFIRLLLERPELARYVQRLELRCWDTLDTFINPLWSRWEMNSEGFAEPSELEYMLIADAAKAHGVIDCIAPYETESSLIRNVNSRCGVPSEPQSGPRFRHLFDSEVATTQVPYSQKFCMLLRAGIEDALITLLIHMLPNIREIFIHAASTDPDTLPWNLPRHKFERLRRFSVRGIGEEHVPITFFKRVLEAKNLDTFEMLGSSGFWENTNNVELALIPNPFSLKPGSLNLSRIELQHCTFTPNEMRTLLEASPQMIRFYYSTGYPEDGQTNIKPAELVDLLKPFENSLEHLCMDMIPYPENNFVQGEHIESMFNFSKLKYLDTAPEMWSRMDRVDVTDRVLEESELLHFRLPPSLMHLIFHDHPRGEGRGSTEISYEQVRRLIPHRRALLPKLKSISMIVRNDGVANRFKWLLYEDERLNMNEEQTKPFNFYIHLRKHRRFFTTTVFNHTAYFADLKIKRWSGIAYKDVEPDKPNSRELTDGVDKDNSSTIPDSFNMEDLRSHLTTTDEPADNAGAGDLLVGEDDDDWQDCESEDTDTED